MLHKPSFMLGATVTSVIYFFITHLKDHKLLVELSYYTAITIAILTILVLLDNGYRNR